jgi:hypothetical protein
LRSPIRLAAPVRLAAVVACLAAGAGPAPADESGFLRSLAGDWSGKGSVKVRVTAPTIRVSCKFKSTADAGSLVLDGNCRGLLVFSRHISATLKANGSKYSGTYVGAGTGPAGLKGVRTGSAIGLGITWAKPVNGDRKATMTVEKNGDNGMTLTTTDVDPKTGKSVVTSRIELKRM